MALPGLSVQVPAPMFAQLCMNLAFSLQASGDPAGVVVHVLRYSTSLRGNCWDTLFTHVCSITQTGLLQGVYIWCCGSLETRLGFLEMGHTIEHRLQHTEGPGEPHGASSL